jgi:CBS domain-containing protein
MTMNVRDVMTTPVIAVSPSTPLKEVARLLVEHRISGLPVVDDAGAVVGVVSEADFLLKEGGREVARRRWFGKILGESREASVRHGKLTAVTAGELMTSPATTIDADRSTMAAATMMVDGKINRLPVVEGGKLVGILSRADLVRAFVRTDEQLAQTIRHDVLLRVLWLNPETFDIVVENGVVTINGRVERKSTAQMLERAVRNVPGVVDVIFGVTWSFEDEDIREQTVDPVFPFSPR